MNVLHVISSVAPRYGGPSAAVRGMSRAMAAQGARVTVATTDADGPGRLTVPLGVPVVEDGVEFRYFRSWLTDSWHFSAGLTRWLARAVAGFDVVEVHGLFTYTTIPGCRLAARSGVPYVVRPLGTLGAWSLAQRSWKKRPYYALFERRNLARASAIHVTAPSEAEEARVLGFGEKAHVIPLGVDVIESPAPRATPGDGAVRLLFLSRIHKKKGLEMLLAALAALRARSGAPSVTLAIAGDGDAEYLRSLREEARRLGVEGIVDFIGTVQGDAKRAAFANADVFVLPSYNENFGIAAAEALAAGVPVILSTEVGLAAAVVAAGAGVSVPLDVDALASAIGELARDPALRAQMSERARDYAVRNLSWAECARRLTNLYSEIIAGSAR